MISLIMHSSFTDSHCCTLYTQSQYNFIKAHIFVGEEALGASVIDSANHRMSVQRADHSGLVASFRGRVYPGTLQSFQLPHVTFHHLSSDTESLLLLIFEPLKSLSNPSYLTITVS